MPFIIADRVRETSVTTGTGSITLAGAVTGYQTFDAVLDTSDTTYYTVADQGGNNWEVGIGTFTAPSTLARTTILSSSNGGSIVNFGAGTKDVFISLPASRTNVEDQPNLIEVNSSSAALRITQTGSGNALLVEGNATFAGTAAMASSFLRNRIINGAMFVSQRATSATVTAGTGVPTASTGYPCVDRFFVYSTGANVTAAQVTATGATPFLLRITGAASVTAVGVGQRIETNNSIDLAGQTCTLSVELANSLLTTVTWTASYATTTDTFGSIGTPTKTQIATGTFTVTSTLTRYSVNIAVPSAATTGIEILFTVGAQTSGTWDIDNVQFEPGTIATPFERRQFGQELALCQRYYEKSYDPAVTPGTSSYPGSSWGARISGGWDLQGFYKVTKRGSPTITTHSPQNGTAGTIRNEGIGGDETATISAIGTGSFLAAGTSNTTPVLFSMQWVASAEL